MGWTKYRWCNKLLCVVLFIVFYYIYPCPFRVYRQSPVRMPNGSGVRWAECLLIIGTGCRVQVFSLILDSSVVLSAGIQSAEDWVSETFWVRILHSAEEDNLSPFDSKIACLCQRIEINNNKYVYRQSQVRMPNGSGVRWAECLLIIGTGCRVQVFSLILDSSVVLSAGIQSAEDWVSETLWVRILHSTEEDKLSPFDSKIACLCQSIEINNNKYVYRQSQVRMPNGSGVRWVECLLIIGTGCRVQVFSLILDSSVGLSAGIQSSEDWVSETLWVRILHSGEEDNLSPFDSKIACLCQSIEINNNKYVCMYICMYVNLSARTKPALYVHSLPRTSVCLSECNLFTSTVNTLHLVAQ